MTALKTTAADLDALRAVATWTRPNALEPLMAAVAHVLADRETLAAEVVALQGRIEAALEASSLFRKDGVGPFCDCQLLRNVRAALAPTGEKGGG